MCAQLGTDINAFDGTYSEPYMTGGPGAGQIAATDSASYPWPAPTFTDVAANQMAMLPQYTQTATPISLPGPTFTDPSSSSTISAGSGWANAQDTRQAFGAIQGCTYPDEYDAENAPIVAGMCGAGLTQQALRRAAIPGPTPAP